MLKIMCLAFTASVFLLGFSSAALAKADGTALFAAKCNMCHAVDRKKVGPAPKCMNTDAKVLRTTIANGRRMMPPYGEILDAEEIDALVAYIGAQQDANPCKK